MIETAAGNVPEVQPGRIASVDLLRGITMAAMIVVNNPGSWVHMMGSLAHAPWGAIPAPADFVFPFFLFLVGVATPLALQRRVHEGGPRRGLLLRALRRAGVLFAIGLFLNLFPQFEWSTLRVPGVLQRIAVVSAGCAAVFLFLRPRGVLVFLLTLLGGYALLLLVVPVPGVGVPMLTAETNLPVWLDEKLLGAHTWRGPGDPEGILSTLGALATGAIGVLAGHAFLRPWPVTQRAWRLALGGSLALGLGALATPWLPVSKELWTPDYALLTTGVALLALALLHRGDPRRAPGRDVALFTLLGRQALLAYVVAHLLSDLSIAVIRVPVGDEGSLSLHSFLYQRLLLSWLPPGFASLGFSLGFLGIVALLVRFLDRRGVRIPV